MRKQLKDIAIINPKCSLPEIFEYVDLESVIGTEMKNHRTEKKGSAPSRAQRLAQKGDIFFQTVRPYQQNNYYFDLDANNFVFSTGYAQICSKVNPKYLFTILQQSSFLDQVLENCTGTSYPAIAPSALSNLYLNVCVDPNEQNLIASYFQSLDTLIQATSKQLASLKQIKAASLQSMFPQEGETKPRVRFKGFEGEWKYNKIGEITFSYSGGTPTVGRSEFYGGNIPFIRSGEIHNDKTELYLSEKGLKSSSAKMVKEGTILYALYGATSGEVDISRINGAINQAILAIIPNENIDNYFLVSFLKKEKEAITSTLLQGGQGNLSGALIKNIAFLHPQLPEQQKIGSYFRNLDRQITLQARRLEKLKQIKAACLDKMFV